MGIQYSIAALSYGMAGPYICLQDIPLPYDIHSLGKFMPITNGLLKHKKVYSIMRERKATLL